MMRVRLSEGHLPLLIKYYEERKTTMWAALVPGSKMNGN
jgi:hypothetical protein